MKNQEYENFLKEFNREEKTLNQIMALSIYIERQVDRIIREHTAYPKLLLEFSASAKYKVIRSLDLVPEYIYHNLTVFNTVRNKFAHYSDMSFSKINKAELKWPDGKVIDLKTLEDDYERILYVHALLYVEISLQ